MIQLPQRRFVIVHGIPSPYRLHLFSCLHACLAKQGWQLEVHFMDLCRGDRAHWNANLEVPFEYKFWRNWQLPGKKGRFNPSLIAALYQNPPEIVLFGGVWDSVTSMTGISLLRRSKLIGWYEANDLIPGRMGWFSTRLKQFLLRKLDWHAIPGQRAYNFLEMLFQGEQAEFNISYLPNLVNEDRFTARHMSVSESSQLRESLGLPLDKTLLFTPARLIPKKGLVGFLRAFKEANLPDVHYFILGDGPLREEVVHTIKELELEDEVTLQGFIAYDEMPNVYAMVDVFCLPSLSDPNPLSVVEAMHSGLPVLLSDKVGNFPEAMSESGHGFAFNPEDQASIINALRQMFGSDAAQFSQMSVRARAHAQKNWGSFDAIERFLGPILKQNS